MPFRSLAVTLLVSTLVVTGCDSKTSTDNQPAGSANGASANAGGAATPGQPEKGYLVGRVRMENGSAPSVPGITYDLGINGLSGPGENVRVTIEPNPDGTFKTKLPTPGIFGFPPHGHALVPFEGKKYVIPLDVTGYKKNQKAEDGITQDIVWKLTGPTPTATNPDPSNHTHWYGISIPVSFQQYRDDSKPGNVKPLPTGTKLTWTLKPLSKLIDGSEAKPLTVEHTIDPNTYFPKLHDLPAANYELSGVAKLPDGSTKTILLRTLNQPDYVPTVKVILQPDASDNRIFVPPVGWVVE